MTLPESGTRLNAPATHREMRLSANPTQLSLVIIGFVSTARERKDVKDRSLALAALGGCGSADGVEAERDLVSFGADRGAERGLGRAGVETDEQIVHGGVGAFAFVDRV